MTIESVIKSHGKNKGMQKQNRRRRSSLEIEFELQMRADKIHEYVIEYMFHPVRKWRFDYAWPEIKFALEIEGGSWLKTSGHTSGIGFLSDCEKYDEAMRLGWVVYRAHGDFVRSGRAIETLKILLEMRQA